MRNGTANLESGRAEISFDREFKTAIGDAIPTVVVTPFADKDIYLIDVDSDGFNVREHDDGTSNVMFNWIAIHRPEEHSSSDAPEEAPPVPIPDTTEELEKINPGEQIQKEFEENPVSYSYREWQQLFEEAGRNFISKEKCEHIKKQ
ncbi:MAG: hypothetical protein ACLFSQ_09115 [Candidatus Zixiibacteriota bacterium]